MKPNFRIFVALGAAAVVYSAAARADAPPASPDQVQNLIADIKAHEGACAKVTKQQSLAYTRCQNEEASLITRQKGLGVTDDAVNGSIKTRGWRWP